jgi:SAM-dependent methyltransferase
VDEALITRATYDRIAQDYAERWATNDEVTKKARERFLTHLPTRATIVDIGCGPGRDAQPLTNAGCSVVALDLSLPMVAEARKRFQGSLLVADMRVLPFQAASFDGAWVCASLLHLPKREVPTTLRLIRATLKSEGILFVGVKEGTGEKFRSRDGHKRFFSFYSEDEICTLMNQAGFGILESWLEVDDVHPDPWINVVAKRLERSHSRR